jgi:hypothetical protein
VSGAKDPATDTSAYVFATDLEDEGIARVLENLRERAGLSGVTLAAAYHAARDVFPHNPRRRVGFLAPGVFFHHDDRLYDGTPVKPRRSTITGGRDTLARASEAAATLGTSVNAWVVFLHVDADDDRAGGAPRNAFGDPFPTDLCPANPAARRYAVALAADVARYRPARIVAESLHYPLLEHGYHHERYFLHLGPLARFLLALCFCRHCLEAARAADVDGEAVRCAVASRLERVFAQGDGDRSVDVSPAAVGSLAGGELGAYLGMRESVVSSLVREVADAARASGSTLTFCDLSGAVKGYATGRPDGDLAAAIAWRFGIGWRELAAACDEVAVCGYASDPERVRADVEAYVEQVGDPGRLALTLRPVPPDCDSAENLRAKLDVARGLGVRRVDFYHYGLAPLGALDLIRAALDRR